MNWVARLCVLLRLVTAEKEVGHTHTQAMKLPTGQTYNHSNSIYTPVCWFSLHINIGRYLRGLAI